MMDSFDIKRLFSDQKMMKKYVKKDYIRVYEGRFDATHAKLTCHTLTDKLIDFNKGELILEGYMESDAAGQNLAGGDVIGFQNGFYSALSDIKISFNNHQVEHNREPLFTTTYLNLLEYSPDYTESVAKQYGFIRDHENAAGAGYDLRNGLSRGAFANHRYPFTLTIPLKHISQFMRRLDFPIMNQLVEIEFNINARQSIIRAGVTNAARFKMTSVTLFVPEVVLPTKEVGALYTSIKGGKFVKEVEWDQAEIYTRNTNVVLNTPFNELLGTNLVGVSKIIAVILPNYNSQEHNQTVSPVAVTDFNIEIDSKDYFNMNVRTDQEAYRLLTDNFNMGGLDVNTGSMLPIDSWKRYFRIYAVDLTRQLAFESDPFASQQIRIRGTPSAAGVLRVFIFRNAKTQIDFSHPENTRSLN